MKQLLHFALVASLALAASCGHAAVAPQSVGALGFGRYKSIPQTVHVIPFYDYTKAGYDVGGQGGHDGLIGDASALYGSTIFGGDAKCSTSFNSSSQRGCGIVYRLTPATSDNYTLKTLHAFKGAPNDGAAAYGTMLQDGNGDLYGTTFYGGQYDAGTIFKLHAVGSQYKETIVHSFGEGQDGAYPVSEVIEVNGTLYGTTIGGGAYTNNVICKRFGGSPNGTCGTIYSVNLTSGAEQVLHSFGSGSDGASPWAAPLAVGNTLYGTTYLGGTLAGGRCGTVYSIAMDGSNEQVIHNFANNPTDGCDPLASLIAVKGVLYGTTCCGGGYYCYYCQGTIFSVDIATGTEQVLHNFGYDQDGGEPVDALTDVRGVFYGTTSTGGTHQCPTGVPCGTIFSYDPSPKNPKYTVLYDFKGHNDGAAPTSSLIYSQGAFYGTTVYGGRKHHGTGVKLSL